MTSRNEIRRPPPSAVLAGQSGMPSPHAAGVLYERHSNRVLGYCLSRFGSREDAEDALQTTFVYALRSLRRGVVPRNEEAWLLTIAHKVCLSGRRSARCRGHRELLRDPQALADAAAVEQRPDELFGLREALADMPRRQCQALLLREWQGLSYREIGASLGLGQAAVETLLFRARRSLAQALDSGASVRRRLGRALDLGFLVGGLKSLFVGGSAAKVAAAAAVSVAATTMLASDTHRVPAPVKPPRASAAPERADHRPAAARASLDRPRNAGRSTGRPLPERRSPPSFPAGGEQPTPAAEPGPPTVESPPGAPPEPGTIPARPGSAGPDDSPVPDLDPAPVDPGSLVSEGDSAVLDANALLPDPLPPLPAPAPLPDASGLETPR